MKNPFAPAIIFIIIILLSMLRADTAALKDKVDVITGGTHTRIIWLHGNAESRMSGGGDLWGFDSKTGVSKMRISGAGELFYMPILCSGGNKVVITSMKDFKVYIFNWDGSGKKYIARGACSDVWKDPATGKEWAVVHTRTTGTWNSGSGIIVRYLIENPTQKKTLWNKWSVKGEPWYQVSADGHMGVGTLPWDDVYHVQDGGLVTNGAYTEVSWGCWPSVTPDNSKYWFNLGYNDGHDHVKMYRGTATVKAEVSIFPGSVPVSTLFTEMYHPKFASYGARYFVETAGYTGNRGATTAEVYFGKFSADYKMLGTCVRMTGDKISDYWPDAWVGVETIKELNLNTSSLQFAASLGGSASAPQTVTATAVGDLDLSGIQVTENASWLSTAVGGSGTTRLISNTINMTGLTAGTKNTTVTVTADGKSKQYTVSLIVTDPSAYHRKFDFGDSPVTGWESADAYLTDGKNVATGMVFSTGGLAGAAPTAVYQTCRHQGRDFDQPVPIDFKLSVPNGTYTVRCHMAEWYYKTLAESNANRSIDITIEGKLAADNLAPMSNAPSITTAVVLDYTVTVADNRLDLTVVNDGGNDAYLMGLEVIGATSTEIREQETGDGSRLTVDSRQLTKGQLYRLDGVIINRSTAPAGIYILKSADGVGKVIISR